MRMLNYLCSSLGDVQYAFDPAGRHDVLAGQ